MAGVHVNKRRQAKWPGCFDGRRVTEKGRRTVIKLARDLGKVTKRGPLTLGKYNCDAAARKMGMGGSQAWKIVTAHAA